MNSARIFLFVLTLLVLLCLPLFPLSPLSSLLTPSPTLAAPAGGVVINEIQIDGDGEWINLYNPTAANVDLEGSYWCYFTSARDWNNPYRSKALSGQVPSYGYFLLRIDGDVLDFDWDTGYVGASSTLNNSTGSVGIFPFDPETKTSEEARGGRIDAVAWGEVDYVKEGSETVAPGENQSIIRNPVGQDTDNNSEDFVIGGGAPEGDDGEDKEATYSAQIFLNEIMPDPVGSDDDEYLEIYNASDEEVDVKNWVLKDLTSDKVIGPEASPSSTLIPAKGFLVIYKKDGSVSLNNDGDTISLLNPKSEVADKITYPKIKEGWVYQRYPDGSASWSESNQPTAGAKNKPSSSSSDTSGTSSDPEVSFAVVGDEFKVNQSFDVKIKIENARPRHDYYVKVRLGLEAAKLAKGRTYNGFLQDWLADSGAWKNFPVVYTDGNGSEGLTVSAKVASGNPAGTYIIGVRIRDKETEGNYDSATQTIGVGAEGLLAADAVDPGDSDGTGSVLGAATELPATGGMGVTDLFVTLLLVVGVTIRFWVYSMVKMINNQMIE